ncbi:MAG: methyltransferase domain-containing protein [Flavobacteriaceae bacterium]
MSAKPFDRLLAEQRRRRALASGAGADFLLARVADDLGARLSAVERRFGTAVDLFGATGAVAAAIEGSGRAERVIRVETDAGWLEGGGIVADAERLPLAAQSVDLAVSAFGLQWVNDLPGVLRGIREALRPDGLLLLALAGGDTLSELRLSLVEAETELSGGAAPRVAPMVDIRSLGALAQAAGLALPVCDVERLVVRYDGALELMRDLRGMGATSPLAERSRKPLRRAVLMRACEIYAERFADPDGRVRATFDILHLSGWAPHESQQKPLRPGSARTRLADVLKPREG